MCSNGFIMEFITLQVEEEPRELSELTGSNRYPIVVDDVNSDHRAGKHTLILLKYPTAISIMVVAHT